MATPNLGLAHIAAAQNQPEVTANDAFDALDTAGNHAVSIENSDADQTLTQAQLASGVSLTIVGAITANRHVNLPASIGRLFLFLNSTTGGYSLIVQVTGVPGTTVTLAAAAGLVLLYSDGTNVKQITGAGAGGSSPNFADAETPSGAINSSNTAFTLAFAPSPAASLLLVLNGVVLKAGGADYTLSGTGITMTAAPSSGDVLLAWYRY